MTCKEGRSVQRPEYCQYITQIKHAGLNSARAYKTDARRRMEGTLAE